MTVKVRPTNSIRFTEKIGTLMWDMHDVQLRYLRRIGSNVHGGEFLCVRKGLLRELPEVINEDAFLCIKASKNDLSVVYLEDEEAHNLVPSNLMDLFQQRRRVNFGHLEIQRIGWDPRIMDTLMFNDPSLFLEIFVTFLREAKWNVFTLFGAISIEVLANLSARMDYFFGKDHRKWTMVKRETTVMGSSS